MQEEIEALNIQAAFIGALIFAVGLNLYAVLGYKDLLINRSSSNFSRKKLYNIALFSANITLIVTIYFLLLTYETYKKEQSQANYNYFISSVLSLTAQSLRTTTLIKFPGDLKDVADIL